MPSRGPEGVADGTTVAFTVADVDLPANRYRRRIWLAALDGGRTGAPVLLGAGGPDGPVVSRWSLDRLRVSAPGAPPGICVMAAINAGERLVIATWATGPTELAWAPDGSQLAFVARDPDPEARALGSDHDGSVIDHLSIQCRDMAASSAFYDAVLDPIGGERILDFGEAIGYGIPPHPDFWIGAHSIGDGFSESHIAFTATDRRSVVAFFEAAVACGAEVLHTPRHWPEYHEHYYGAFVRDPDGNNVEAVCHKPE